MGKMGLSFMAACNDWRNGSPLGVFEHSEIQRDCAGCVVELEHLPTAVNFNSQERSLYVGRIRVPYLRYRPWVGNWCWDEWHISDEAAAKIINYLRAKRAAHYIGGECEVCDRIEGKQNVEAKDLADAVQCT